MKFTEADCSACAAPCCRAPFRSWLSYRERTSGLYEYDMIEPDYGLSALKQVDGKCVYLDPETYRCKVYDKRPQTCRDYGCSNDSRVTEDMQSRESNPCGVKDVEDT